MARGDAGGRSRGLRFGGPDISIKASSEKRQEAVSRWAHHSGPRSSGRPRVWPGSQSRHLSWLPGEDPAADRAHPWEEIHVLLAHMVLPEVRASDIRAFNTLIL